MVRHYVLGVDFGTEAARAPLVDVANGREIATTVAGYRHGHKGVVLSRDPNLARQHPADYLECAARTIKGVLSVAQRTMTALKPRVFEPNRKAHAVYRQLYTLYRQLHGAFGTTTWTGNRHNVMKDLLELCTQARK